MQENDPVSPCARRAFGVFVGGIVVAIAITGFLAFRSRLDVKPLIVGFTEFSPYVWVTNDGKPAGLAVDVVNDAARRSGQRLVWKQVEDGESALREGTIDIFPLLTATPDRTKRFLFSEYWWQNNLEVVSSREHPINRAADVARKRVGVRMKGLVINLARSLFPSASVIAKPNVSKLVDSFCSGEVDAMFVDARTIRRHLVENPLPCEGRRVKFTPIAGATLPLGTASTRAVRNSAELLFTHIYEVIADGTLANLASGYSLPVPENEQQLAVLVQYRESHLLLKAVCFGLSWLATVLALITLRMQVIHRTAEEARLKLEDSEQRFHAFMDHLPANAFIKDDSGHMVYMNRARDMSPELRPEDCLGKTNFELMPRAIAEQLRYNDRMVLEGDCARQFTEAIPDGTGQIRHWLTEKFPMQNRSGSVFLGGIAMDITEMVQARNELRDSEARYRQIVDYAGDIIVRCDARGRVTFVNDVGARELKIPAPRLLGREVLRLIRRKDRRRLIETLRNKLHENASDLYIELPVTRGDEVEIWLGQTIRLLRTNGAFTGLQAISRDITDRRRIEGELRASEERFRLLYENSPVAYHEIDPRGLIRRANRAESEMLGIPESELIGRSVLDLIAPEERELARTAIAAKVAEKMPLRPFNRTYVRPDGRRVKVEIHENLFRDDHGSVIRIHSVLLDVTQKHLAEILDHDRRELSEMIAQQQPLERVMCGVANMISHQDPSLRCVPVRLGRDSHERVFEPVCACENLARLCQTIRGLGVEAFALWPSHDFRQFGLDIWSFPPTAGVSAWLSAANELGMRSCWSEPIVSASRNPLGSLLVFSPSHAEPTAPQKQLLQAASRLAAIAIEHRHMTDLLAFQAGHDALTRLPNRATFERLLEEAIGEARELNQQLAVFFVDLDRFKQVNDTLGHSGGDELLRQVGVRLRRCLRRGDLVARIGGDEFSVMLPRLREANDASRVAEALVRAFREPFLVDGSEVFITSSIGISIFPRDGQDATTLQRNSDSAMYRVKNNGKDGFHSYSEDGRSRINKRPQEVVTVN
ncbi:MAG TPA: diguanylate cyclase [Bryobacteraceae bacterium]|jgi:diguanylate cyclase (GGDEF)-like protein/PAS domain S-box-containing protein